MLILKIRSSVVAVRFSASYTFILLTLYTYINIQSSVYIKITQNLYMPKFSDSGMSVYGVKISPMGIATVVGVICLLVFMTGGSSNSAKIESDTVSMRELLSIKF